MIVGVNGTGKTTTVGKLARLIKDSGKAPLICAADTFRAAAVEQLEIWAKRAGVDIIRARTGADPAAVVFDAIAAGKARDRDVVLVDTAGRLHTRVNLMTELDKIRRIAAREVEGAPHEVLLVLDATVGQNGLAQAREFMSVAGVNGIVLTKLDGTAKGGIAVAIAQRSEAADPLRRRRRGDRRPDSVLAGRVRRRAVRGEMVTATRRRPCTCAGAGARGARARHDQPRTRWSARCRRRRRRRGRPRVRTSSPADRTRKFARWRTPGARARGATLYCTLEPCSHTGRTGPCAPASSPPDPARGRCRARIRIRCQRARDRRFSARTASRSTSASLRPRRARLNRAVLHADAARTAVRHDEGRAQRSTAASPRDRGCERALTGAAANRGSIATAPKSTRSRVGSGTLLADDPLLTAARRVPAPAADARRLRPPAADAAVGAPALDARRRPGHNRDDGHQQSGRLGGAPRAGGSGSARRGPGRRRGARSLFGRGAGAAGGDWICHPSSSKVGRRCTRAFWDAGLVDRVQMYVTPQCGRVRAECRLA